MPKKQVQKSILSHLFIIFATGMCLPRKAQRKHSETGKAFRKKYNTLKFKQ